MNCRICGTENNVQLYAGNRGILCADCAADTPEKIGKAEFVRRYFDGETVSDFIAREFYDDFRASNLTFDEYKKATTTEAI